MRSAEPSPLLTRTTLRFRARTLHRWIDGAITSNARRLGDSLNRDDVGGTIIADEFVVDGGDERRGDVPGGTPLGALNINVVLFMFPIETGPPPARDPFAWVKKHPERVKVGTGPYEIEGDLFMVEGVRLKEMIATARPVFIVLAAATVRRLDDPTFIENRGAVFVNRRLMDYLVGMSSDR
ncbi:MAG TPA: hypothetical protein VKT80_19765 [Chloroflexota bacterium]|nr:hypothetical protein [Chloroflexota bacterium]